MVLKISTRNGGPDIWYIGSQIIQDWSYQLIEMCVAEYADR